MRMIAVDPWRGRRAERFAVCAGSAAACLVVITTAALAAADDPPDSVEAPPESPALAGDAAPPSDRAQESAEQTATGDSGAPRPPPYSLPFQLRSAVVATVLRLDSSLAFFEDAEGRGSVSGVALLFASYKFPFGLAPFLRAGLAGLAPGVAEGGVGLTNPALGATYQLDLPQPFKLSFVLGFTIPIGMGGGDSPSPPTAATMRSGVNTRSGMDNALFATNDLAIFPGVDFAYADYGLTLQAEVTIVQLVRVRGEAVHPDSANTNLTAGLHVGYFFVPELSAGVELRYQRWLTTPWFVAADPTRANRDTFTFAVGVRAHLDLGGAWLRPGFSYSHGIDDPLVDRAYHIVQLDLPLSF